MKKTTQKIVLSASRDIPFNKLVLSQSNVRKIKTGVSIEQLAEDIARRTLLQSLNVRPMLDESGAETGFYEIPAGGRRYRALELLVKQKRMAKDQPVPCIVRKAGTAEEDSLAENTHREALHPLDQFRAFQTLREGGLGDEEIAARFFVTPTVVRQRLKLAAVSPELLSLYEAGELSLEQLMAFALSDDHERQIQVWTAISQTGHDSPYTIRRMLTETSVAARDPRALFIGIDAYQQAGGNVTRDLFADGDAAYFDDVTLVERLVDERLREAAATIQQEGWGWVEYAADYDWDHHHGCSRLRAQPRDLTDEESTRRAVLAAELEALETAYEGVDDIPHEAYDRMSTLEDAINDIDHHAVAFDADAMAGAGAFVSIDDDGSLFVERGFIRPDDAAEGEAEDGNVVELDDRRPKAAPKIHPDALVADLSAWRTHALRDAVGQNVEIAYLAVLHSLCLTAFYHSARLSCLEISTQRVSLARDLDDEAPAVAVRARHEAWVQLLPEAADEVWDALLAMDANTRAMLLAHVVSLSVNVTCAGETRIPPSHAHGHQLARAVALDVAAAGWEPTVESYLGRVSKVRILEAVREGKDARSAGLIDHLKKDKMAREAQRLLAGTGWLPAPLRTPPLEAETGADSNQAAA